MIRSPSVAARLRLPLLAALAVLATAACSENGPFEREDTGPQAKLAVPTSITPPISVRGVDGAPDDWKLAERVAEALRLRDIPASAAARRRSALILKGEMRQGQMRNGRSRVEVVWSLYDGVGRKLGEVTQMAAVPGAVFKAPNEGVVEAMADAAAESIAPLVPSSSIRLADATETGERRPNDRSRIEDRDRVTAVGRMPAQTGVAKNLLAAPKRETTVAARVDRTKRGARPPSAAAAPPPERDTASPAGDKKAVTAVGRYEGVSALSRNLLRPEGDPAKPLPPPQRTTRAADRAPPDAEESLGHGPVPASDMKRSEAPAKPRLPQRADADGAKPDVGNDASRAREDRAREAREREARERAARERQYAETDGRTPPRTGRAAPPRGSYQYWIQVGSHRDDATARAEWQKLQTTAGTVLAVGHRIQRAHLGARGTFYRVQLGPFAAPGEAAQFCAQLRARQVACFVAPPEPAAAAAPPPQKPPGKPAEARTKPPAEKPAEARAKPPAEKPADAKAPPPAAKAAPPAEKPKDAASAPPKPPGNPDPPPAKAETKAPTKGDNKPPANAKAEKPEAPVSTAPGLPGVLD